MVENTGDIICHSHEVDCRRTGILHSDFCVDTSFSVTSQDINRVILVDICLKYGNHMLFQLNRTVGTVRHARDDCKSKFLVEIWLFSRGYDCNLTFPAPIRKNILLNISDIEQQVVCACHLYLKSNQIDCE